MDTQNLQGRRQFAWTHRICMDARICMDSHNLHKCTTEFSWTHRICMDAPLNMHGGVVEIVGGRFVIIGAYPV